MSLRGEESSWHPLPLREERKGKEGRTGEGLSQGLASHVLAVKSADRRDLSDPEVGEIRIIFASIVILVRRETLDRIHSKRNDTCI